MIDLVLPHLGPAPLVRKAGPAATTQGRLVRLGRRQARRHAAQQLAVDLRRLGLAMGRATDAVLPAQLPDRTARPELSQPEVQDGACWTSRGSGWTAGSTGSGSTRSTSTSTTRSCATTRRCRWRTQRDHRAGVNPYNWQEHLYDKNQPENLDFPAQRCRAVLDEYPPPPRWARWATRSAGWRSRPIHRGRRQGAHVLRLRVPVGRPPTAEYVAEVLTDFENTIGDGWACWAFSNHDVARHASRWNLGEAARGCSRR
jgi:hypothetical protein